MREGDLSLPAHRPPSLSVGVMRWAADAVHRCIAVRSTGWKRTTSPEPSGEWMPPGAGGVHSVRSAEWGSALHRAQLNAPCARICTRPPRGLANGAGYCHKTEANPATTVPTVNTVITAHSDRRRPAGWRTHRHSPGDWCTELSSQYALVNSANAPSVSSPSSASRFIPIATRLSRIRNGEGMVTTSFTIVSEVCAAPS